MTERLINLWKWNLFLRLTSKPTKAWTGSFPCKEHEDCFVYGAGVHTSYNKPTTPTSAPPPASGQCTCPEGSGVNSPLSYRYGFHNTDCPASRPASGQMTEEEKDRLREEAWMYPPGEPIEFDLSGVAALSKPASPQEQDTHREVVICNCEHPAIRMRLSGHDADCPAFKDIELRGGHRWTTSPPPSGSPPPRCTCPPWWRKNRESIWGAFGQHLSTDCELQPQYRGMHPTAEEGRSVMCSCPEPQWARYTTTPQCLKCKRPLRLDQAPLPHRQTGAASSSSGTTGTPT